MRHRAVCPSCGKSQRVADSDLGQPLICSACGNQFITHIAPPNDTASDPKNASPPPLLLLTASHLWLYLSAVVSLLIILLISFFVLENANRHTGSSEVYVYQRVTPQPQAPPSTTAPATQTVVAATEPATSAPALAATQPIDDVLPPTTSPTAVVVNLRPQTPEPSTGPAKFHPIGAVEHTNTDRLDDQIGVAIQQGVGYLLSQFKTGRLAKVSSSSDDLTSGYDALAVYALLHAGEATHNDKLGPHSPLVDEMLKALKTLPMDHGPATYSRALRTAALAVYNRPEDRAALRADGEWIKRAAANGSYTYEIFPQMRRGGSMWDNSNSQYGALGAWSAEDAGMEITSAFWERVEQHWLSCQLQDGEWAYRPGEMEGRLSMTVAGITTLFVAQDQLAEAKWSKNLGKPPFSPALARGLKWLETDNNAVDLPGNSDSYNLYGLERAALASGFKYFGKHDWYRELAGRMLSAQLPNGAWSQENDIVDTAFTLLFLSRGRHPIFMNKLRLDGFWANRPRDIANLCRYASKETERPMNWQVVSLAADWSDWMDSPVLYIASHQSPKLQKEDYDKLRLYAENGGLIFTQADEGSESFNRFVMDLGSRLFPEYALQNLPPTHDIYHTLFKADTKLPLQGISNGSRLLLLHSPNDLNSAWQRRDWKPRPGPFELGLNVFIYAAGKANLRNKLKTPYVPQANVTPIKTIPMARLRYIGNWDPEPAAWARFSRQFLGETSVLLNPNVTNLRELDAADFPFAHLTGTDEVRFNEDQVKAVRNYVTNGGVLLIDAAGGSVPFAQSIRGDLLQRAFPKENLRSLSEDHPILAGNGEGMLPVRLKLRPHQAEVFGTNIAPLEFLEEGRGCVIFSGLDLSTGLLGTNTYTVAGYDPESAHALVRNCLLWIAEKP